MSLFSKKLLKALIECYVAVKHGITFLEMSTTARSRRASQQFKSWSDESYRLTNMKHPLYGDSNGCKANQASKASRKHQRSKHDTAKLPIPSTRVSTSFRSGWWRKRLLNLTEKHSSGSAASIRSSCKYAQHRDSDTLSLQASVLSDATTFTSQSSGFSRRASIDTLATSRRSSIASVESKFVELSPIVSLDRTTEETPLGGPEQKPSIKGPSTTEFVITRRACRYDCYCECHIQSAAGSAREFAKSKASKIKCTQSNCRRAIYPEEKVHGTAFFRKALSQVLSSKSIKIRYNLNTYRMVSEGSDAM